MCVWGVPGIIPPLSVILLYFDDQAFGASSPEQKAVAVTHPTSKPTRVAAGLLRVTCQDQEGLEPAYANNGSAANHRARFVLPIIDEAYRIAMYLSFLSFCCVFK